MLNLNLPVMILECNDFALRMKNDHTKSVIIRNYGIKTTFQYKPFHFQ